MKHGNTYYNELRHFMGALVIIIDKKNNNKIPQISSLFCMRIAHGLTYIYENINNNNDENQELLEIRIKTLDSTIKQLSKNEKLLKCIASCEEYKILKTELQRLLSVSISENKKTFLNWSMLLPQTTFLLNRPDSVKNKNLPAKGKLFFDNSTVLYDSTKPSAYNPYQIHQSDNNDFADHSISVAAFTRDGDFSVTFNAKNHGFLYFQGNKIAKILLLDTYLGPARINSAVIAKKVAKLEKSPRFRGNNHLKFEYFNNNSYCQEFFKNHMIIMLIENSRQSKFYIISNYNAAHIHLQELHTVHEVSSNNQTSEIFLPSGNSFSYSEAKKMLIFCKTKAALQKTNDPETVGPTRYNLICKSILYYIDFTSLDCNLIFTKKTCSATDEKEIINKNQINIKKGYSLALISDDIKNKDKLPNTLYLNWTNKCLQYEVIDLDDNLKKGNISWEDLPNDFPQKNQSGKNLTAISRYLPELLTITAQAKHTVPVGVATYTITFNRPDTAEIIHIRITANDKKRLPNKLHTEFWPYLSSAQAKFYGAHIEQKIGWYERKEKFIEYVGEIQNTLCNELDRIDDKYYNNNASLLCNEQLSTLLQSFFYIYLKESPFSFTGMPLFENILYAAEKNYHYLEEEVYELCKSNEILTDLIRIISTNKVDMMPDINQMSFYGQEETLFYALLMSKYIYGELDSTDYDDDQDIDIAIDYNHLSLASNTIQPRIQLRQILKLLDMPKNDNSQNISYISPIAPMVAPRRGLYATANGNLFVYDLENKEKRNILIYKQRRPHYNERHLVRGPYLSYNKDLTILIYYTKGNGRLQKPNRLGNIFLCNDHNFQFFGPSNGLVEITADEVAALTRLHHHLLSPNINKMLQTNGANGLDIRNIPDLPYDILAPFFKTGRLNPQFSSPILLPHPVQKDKNRILVFINSFLAVYDHEYNDENNYTHNIQWVKDSDNKVINYGQGIKKIHITKGNDDDITVILATEKEFLYFSNKQAKVYKISPYFSKINDGDDESKEQESPKNHIDKFNKKNIFFFPGKKDNSISRLDEIVLSCLHKFLFEEEIDDDLIEDEINDINQCLNSSTLTYDGFKNQSVIVSDVIKILSEGLESNKVKELRKQNNLSDDDPWIRYVCELFKRNHSNNKLIPK